MWFLICFKSTVCSKKQFVRNKLKIIDVWFKYVLQHSSSVAWFGSNQTKIIRSTYTCAKFHVASTARVQCSRQGKQADKTMERSRGPHNWRYTRNIKKEFVTLVMEHGHIDYDSMCTKSGIVTAKLAEYAFLVYPLFVLDTRGAYMNFKDRRAQHF